MQCDVRAGARQRSRHASAEAARGAGHQRDTPAEIERRRRQNTTFIASWISRGRLVWLVTLPKSALVGSVFGFAYTARLKALSSSIWNCPRTRSLKRICLMIEMSHRFSFGLRSPSVFDGK